MQQASPLSQSPMSEMIEWCQDCFKFGGGAFISGAKLPRTVDGLPVMTRANNDLQGARRCL